MSDAILAFQSQLSGVMETVFKAAMYEITRLVEDSFLEEVSRSREQVESLKQRLQWSESRRREREGGGRVRCADCGRAGVPCEETENTHSGADESRGLKQEKVLEGAWSSCPGETSNVGPPSTPQEPATPSPITAPDMSSQMSQQTHVDGDRLDAMLKEEGMQAAPPPDHLQERWSVCLEGQEGPEGEEPDRAFGEQRLQLCEEEWGPGAGMGADPGRDGSAEGLARAYSARYGVEEELGAALEAESKGEYMVAMLSGSGELDGRSLEDSLLRADGQLNFAAELDPTNSTAEAATHPFGPRGRRPSLGDPQGSPPGDSNVGDLDCLLINEDGYLQDTDGRYRGLRRSRGRGRGEQRGLGPSTEHLLPMPDNSDDQHQGELFSLTHHQRRHSCSQCQVSFPDLGALKAHLLTHRAGSAYTCTQCGKSFTQACNLKVHQRIHSGEGLHLCSHCGKGFISFADLKRHKCSHTSDKPYCCTLCGNKFSRLWNLKLHRRIHTQEKPHRCTQCGKSFTRADILKVHQRTHTGERPYCCAVCGLSFKRLDHLKSHQRKHS